MAWWSWLVLGIVLIAGEVVTPGAFFLLFFGIGAVCVGTLAGLGLALTDWLQWLSFAVISAVLVVFFRTRLRDRLARGATGKDRDGMIGTTALVGDQISVGLIGKVEMRGATWNARNAGAHTLRKGQHCKVVGVEGLTLIVEGSADN